MHLDKTTIFCTAMSVFVFLVFCCLYVFIDNYSNTERYVCHFTDIFVAVLGMNFEWERERERERESEKKQKQLGCLSRIAH